VCACGKTNSPTHANVCKRGGFVKRRSDDLADEIADIEAGVFYGVEVEPSFQQLTGEQIDKYKTAKNEDEAKADIKAHSVWTKNDINFQDVRISYPFAQSYLDMSPIKLHRKNESEKNRGVVQRINEVEHGTFNPLCFTTSGGMGPQTTVFMKNLASRLAIKRREPYSLVMGWIRARIAFALVRSTQVVLRGCRARKRVFGTGVPLDIVRAETGFQPDTADT
jgi:hypothetical protein